MGRVAISNAGKHYGKFEALKGVSIDIDDGEFVTLVGPSGCGKSTLLRMIAGLEEISSGEVQIGDRVVNDVPAKNRDIAMVFQSYALYPHMTVEQNMGFSLMLKRVPKAVAKSRVDDAAQILGLEELLHRQPSQLSGGQRQRVAMGRAIVRDPEVFLFDEPLSNLDAKLRVQMRAEIKELHQKLKTTTIYVTHDQVEAMTMADKIVVMKDGVIEQIGSPLDLYDQPRNTFVAGFIGSPAMNFVSGSVDGNSFRVAGGVELPVSQDDGGKARTYGIRPEHFHLDAEGLEVEVVLTEPTGSETLVRAKIGEELITGVFRERVASRPGDKLRISPIASEVHLFDEAGERLN